MRQGNELTLKDAIEEMIEAYGMEDNLNQAKAIDAWKELVGNVIAKHTRSIYVKKGRLFLYLDSAPLKQELSYQKSTITKKINDLLGKEVIQEVVIR